MFNVYLGDILCPVAPEKILVDYGDGCELVRLADGGELGVSRRDIPRRIEFSLLLPNREYPFAVYRSGFQNGNFYLRKFEEFFNSKTPFRFMIGRPGNALVTNLRCLMEGYRIEENAKFGGDYVVSLKLREYKNFAAKKLDQTTANSIFKSQRSTENSPAPKAGSIFYRVVKDDCMWMIAQRFYGNGNLYDKIYQANVSKLAGRSPKYLIFVGDLLEIPPL